MADTDPAIKRIGRLVAEYRAQTGLTQEKLAEAIPDCNRSHIAYLEEGQRLPTPDLLERICEHLKIPHAQWFAATHPGYVRAMEFLSLTSEFVGKPLTLDYIDGYSAYLCVQKISTMLSDKMTGPQFFAYFNSFLTFCGERPVSWEFFDRFIEAGAFADVDAFRKRVREFQKAGLRLYGNFRRAWTTLAYCCDLEAHLKPLLEVPIKRYTDRRPFDTIDPIASERLDELGYVAVERIKKEQKDRKELSDALHELALGIEKTGVRAIQATSGRRMRRIRTLLRKFECAIDLEPSLFTTIDHTELEAEAKRVAPQDYDLVQIDQTQTKGLRNLAAYLTEPYIDAYVATSMRDHADFVSVNQFVEALFNSPELSTLKLRYFNPTQSWIADRVAKGLVEALMLRRSKVTVYMAQKGDTFGKDSEASVALGQGKPVIVYVPKLCGPDTNLDSEFLFSAEDRVLSEHCVRLKIEHEDGMDRPEKIGLILRQQLEALSVQELARIIRKHWADFDLYGEIAALQDVLKKPARAYLDAVTKLKEDDPKPLLELTVAQALAFRLVDVAIKFESRAHLFREVGGGP